MGLDLAARAPALELVVDSDALPVPAHPAFDATIPETSATLESGPLGHGLSSLVWPGDLAGHFGSAIQQLGQLCSSLLPISLPNVPTQCLPVPQGLKDNASALNDPFKAETFFPGGPTDNQYTTTPAMPGVTMTSHADGNKVESVAGFATFGAAGLGTLGSVTSRSVVTSNGTAAVSEATSELFNVALAGGLVTVDHIQSTAKETTDGQKAAGTGTTIINGLRIGGIPASIDTSGLRVGALSAAANKALNALGLEIKLTVPDVVADGSKGSFTAPLLVITYRDDQNALEAAATALGQKLTTGALQQVTGALQQLALGPQSKVTLALGGSAVAVDASPEVPLPPEAAAAGAQPTPEGVESIATPGSPGAPASVEALTISPASAAVASRNVRALPRARAAGFLGGFGGLAWGLVLGAVAASLALAFGLHRYALAVDTAGASAPSACPHDALH